MPETPTHATDLVAEKCAACGMSESPVFGGYGWAKSWAEIDAYEIAHEQSEAVGEVVSQFQALIANIFTDPGTSPAEKAAAIRAAADGVPARIAEAEAEAAMEKAAKTEGGIEYQASDYADVPDPNTPSTWKLRLAEGRSGNITVAQVARAITALQPGGFRGQRVELGSSKASVISKISSAIGRASGDGAAKRNLRERLSRVKEVMAEDATTGEPDPETPGALRITKDANGNLRWLAIYSNNAYDRDGEVIPHAVHVEYAEHVQKSGDYPELWLWHTPGTRVGIADWVDVSSEGFALASGTFDPGQEHIAKSLGQMPGLGVSHGFRYDRIDSSGAYGRYRTYEISPLPMSAAANQGTGFGAVTTQEDPPMPLTPERKTFLANLLGEDTVAAIETGLSKAYAAGSEAGVTTKDVAEALAELATPEPETVAEAPTEPAGLSLDAITAAVQAAIAPIAARLDSIEAETKDLRAQKTSLDQQVAAAINPRNGTFVASASNKAYTEKSADALIQDAVKAGLVRAGFGPEADAPDHLRDQVALLGALTGNR